MVEIHHVEPLPRRFGGLRQRARLFEWLVAERAEFPGKFRTASRMKEMLAHALPRGTFSIVKEGHWLCAQVLKAHGALGVALPADVSDDDRCRGAIETAVVTIKIAVVVGAEELRKERARLGIAFGRLSVCSSERRRWGWRNPRNRLIRSTVASKRCLQ